MTGYNCIVSGRTVARKSPIGGLYVRAGGGLKFKFDENSTNL